MHLEKPSRELFVGEIISQAFQLYTRNFVLFYLPVLIAGLISGVSSSIWLLSFPLPASPPPGASPEVIMEWSRNFLWAVFGFAVVNFLISYVVSSIAIGMVVKSASDILEKRGATLQKSFNFVVYRLPSLLGASILTGILTFIGMLMIIIPGIILMIMFSLVIPAVVIEQKGIFESLGRSSRLVSHRWLNTFALLLIIGLIIFAVSLIASLIFLPFGLFTATAWLEPTGMIVVSLLVSIFITSFAAPIMYIALTLLYYSMLVKEASQLPPPPPV